MAPKKSIDYNIPQSKRTKATLRKWFDDQEEKHEKFANSDRKDRGIWKQYYNADADGKDFDDLRSEALEVFFLNVGKKYKNNLTATIVRDEFIDAVRDAVMTINAEQERNKNNDDDADAYGDDYDDYDDDDQTESDLDSDENDDDDDDDY